MVALAKLKFCKSLDRYYLFDIQRPLRISGMQKLMGLVAVRLFQEFLVDLIYIGILWEQRYWDFSSSM